MENSYTRLIAASGNKRHVDIYRDLEPLGMNNQQTITNWANRGKVPIDWIRKAASVYKVSSDWIETGAGEMRKSQITESNVSESGSTLRPIPIISWVQAGAFVESNVIDETWAVSDYVHATSNVSDKAFALRVEGDSMVSHTGGYSFPEGVIIICDPEQSASVGSFVIAKDTTTQGTTFKRLDGDGLTFKLTALNSDKYEPIPINNGNIRIIAKVVDSLQRLP